MIKNLLLICLLTVLATHIYAQQERIDDLKLLVAKHSNDTTGVELFRKLSRQIQSKRPDSALFYAQKGLDLARKLSFKKGEANCLNRLGIVLWKNGKYDRALSFLINSLKIREDIKDRLGEMQSLSDIGIVYADQMDNRQALSYHFKAKIVAEELQDKRRLGIILSNIGNCYIKLNKVDSALTYEMQAYSTQQSIKDTLTLPNTLSILGDIHYKMGHNSLALDFYRISIKYATKNDDQFSLADSYNSIATLYNQSGKTDSSIIYALKATDAAKAAMYPEGIYNASNTLTEVYQQQKNEHLELLYLKKALAAKDSMFNAEKIKQIQTLSFNEAARQEEIIEEKHREESKRLINLQLIAIAVFIPFFFLTVLLLSRSRTHRKVIDFLSILSLLLFFEFLNLLIHPAVLRISDHLPVLELLILVVLASILAPLHHRLTHWVQQKLSHSNHHNQLRQEKNENEEDIQQTSVDDYK